MANSVAVWPSSQTARYLKFAEQVNKKITHNLSFTFLYNAIGIPIAISGLISPLVAVTSMLLSILSVTGITLMLVQKQLNFAIREIQVCWLPFDSIREISVDALCTMDPPCSEQCYLR